MMRALLRLPARLVAASFASVRLNLPWRTLAGTQPLTWTDDLASRLVDGVDRFLLGKLEASIAERAKHWQRDFSSPEAYQKSIEPNRKRLAHILGVRDERLPFDGPESSPHRRSRRRSAAGPATRSSPSAGRPCAASTAKDCF